MSTIYNNSYLAHHGIKGQKWGVRRFEDKNGHLTAAGKKRYDDYDYDKPKKKSGIFARMRQNRDERLELMRTMGKANNRNVSKTGTIYSKEMQKSSKIMIAK